jgi:hypothetical protein
MAELLADMAQAWDRVFPDTPSAVELDDSGRRVLFSALLDEIEYYAQRRYYEYAPTATGPFQSFMERLEIWVAQAIDEQDRKALLRLAQHIFFVGAQEFAALYRTAFGGIVSRWIIDQLNLQLDDPSIHAKIDDALKRTWFCPITDSMQIAAFCHVNRITGFELRPDWRSMAEFSRTKGIQTYIRRKGIERMVLLEDFVGSGTQMSRAVKFAAEKLPKLPILVAPLITASPGRERGRDLAAKYPNVIFSPVLVLPHTTAVAQILTRKFPKLFGVYRDLAQKYCPAVSNGGVANLMARPYGPLGFKRTGGLVVMYTNCPNNTMPLIHHTGTNWKPLFPRSSRV